MRLGAALSIACIAGLAGCAGGPPHDAGPRLSLEAARALVNRAVPPGVADRAGWSTDIHAAFTTLQIEPDAERVCAVVAVIEQESSFRVDPAVPGLGAIAWREIDAKAERAGVPKLLVHGALKIASKNGRSYSDRIDAATTELELSRIFDDMVDTVPLGRRLFGDYNPVRTGGPMQVGVAYAEAQVQRKPYPYPLAGSVRDEVFSRRGGVYFGTSHLLDYPASYDALIFRYADFNAGHYASRNAAFQNAVSVASGVPLDLDGDLVAFDGDRSRPPGATEAAVRVLGARLDLGDAAIRRALEQGATAEFERTALYERVFALAERTAGRRLARAVLPRIALHSPKITRQLTTEWFARRVDERQKRCVGRVGNAAPPLAAPRESGA